MTRPQLRHEIGTLLADTRRAEHQLRDIRDQATAQARQFQLMLARLTRLQLELRRRRKSST